MQSASPDSATVRIYRVSPGRVNAYATCPLNYRRVQLKQRRTTSEALRRGVRIHDLLQRYNKFLIANHVAPDIDTFIGAGRRLSSVSADELMGFARQVLVGYADFLHDQNLTVRAAEEWIKTPARPLLGAPDLAVELSGVPDVVAMRPNGTVVLIDLKTGSTLASPVSLAEAPGSFVYAQLGEYAYGTSDIEIAQILPHQHDWTCVQLDETCMQASRAMVRAMVLAMDTNDFPPRPSQYCAICSIEAECPARRPRSEWVQVPF